MSVTARSYVWRAMTAVDLTAACKVADAVHPLYPEDAAVFADRLELFPAGCLVLQEKPGGIAGYAVSHPWQFGDIPALNTRLGRLPEAPDTFYIHDVALLPEARGRGLAAAGVALLLEVAGREGLKTVSLVAIRGAGALWKKLGFLTEDVPSLRRKLAAYDDQARFMVRRREREGRARSGALPAEDSTSSSTSPSGSPAGSARSQGAS
jgi:GNAT superfamily N-acetyltransferase